MHFLDHMRLNMSSSRFPAKSFSANPVLLDIRHAVLFIYSPVTAVLDGQSEHPSRHATYNPVLAKFHSRSHSHAAIGNPRSGSLQNVQCFNFQDVNNARHADLIDLLMVWLLTRVTICSSASTKILDADAHPYLNNHLFI